MVASTDALSAWLQENRDIAERSVAMTMKSKTVRLLLDVVAKARSPKCNYSEIHECGRGSDGTYIHDKAACPKGRLDAALDALRHHIGGDA